LDIGDGILGDEGTAFDSLESPAGRRCKNSLTGLFFTKNGIGAKGLLAVSVKDNHVLRELCLSGESADLIKISSDWHFLMINAEPLVNEWRYHHPLHRCTEQTIHAPAGP
jgi:hypothetical protein